MIYLTIPDYLKSIFVQANLNVLESSYFQVDYILGTFPHSSCCALNPLSVSIVKIALRRLGWVSSMSNPCGGR